MASSPIEWHFFQTLMGEIGYEMLAHAPGERAVISRLKAGAATEGYRNPVTVSYPECVSTDGVTPAYERDFVIDLLSQITGSNGEKAILTILAHRRLNG